jgi:hypothetical protein
MDELDVHESVHRDTTMKITNKMHYIYWFIIPCRLYMFRVMFSPIIRSTWLYLQYLVVFTQVAAGWCRRMGGSQGRSGQVLKISPHRDSILGPSSPLTVAIPTTLPGPLKTKPGCVHILLAPCTLVRAACRGQCGPHRNELYHTRLQYGEWRSYFFFGARIR